MNSSQRKVAVILPTLNEKTNLELLLPKILEIQEVSIVIIVDDNSTDGSKKFFEEVTCERLLVINRPHRLGIGSAHFDGLVKAKDIGADLIVTMDADGTHRTEDLKKFLVARNDFDLLIGSRYEEGGKILGWGVFRYVLTQVGHLATSVFFKSDLDMSSGMRAYKASAIPFGSLQKNCNPDYSFFFVSLLVYKNENLRITQIPIELNNRISGKSKMIPVLMLRGVYTLFLYGVKIKKIKN
jgi:dolichol-phosphate mannosyltransferase